MIRKWNLEIENNDSTKYFNVDILKNDTSQENILSAINSLKLALSLTLIDKNVQDITIHVKTNEPLNEIMDSPLSFAFKCICSNINKSSINYLVEHVLNERLNDEFKTKRLTHREQEIVKFIKQGLTTNLISEQLKISPRTVKTHRNHIHKKLAIHKSAELIDWINRNK